MVITKNSRNRYIGQACRVCGANRLVRLVKGKPTSDLCHYCSVRTSEYRAKMASKTRNNYKNGVYAT